LGTFDAVKVALVGIDIAGKTSNSSRPLASTVFAKEISTAQAMIDQLMVEGIRL
jgi:5'-nucleotidase